jgi:DedD protein
MDRGLKERLVGAAVLVVLGVWLIPWVLNGPERSAQSGADALELPVPSESASLRSQTITLDNDREPPTPAVGHSAPEDHAAVSAAAQEGDSAPPPPPPPTVTAAPDPSPPDVAVATDDAGWYVQIGSYADEENARRQADRVSTYGYEARVFSYTSSGRLMRRVRVGPQESRARAETVASALSAHGFVAQVVVED